MRAKNCFISLRFPLRQPRKFSRVSPGEWMEEQTKGDSVTGLISACSMGSALSSFSGGGARASERRKMQGSDCGRRRGDPRLDLRLVEAGGSCTTGGDGRQDSPATTSRGVAGRDDSGPEIAGFGRAGNSAPGKSPG